MGVGGVVGWGSLVVSVKIKDQFELINIPIFQAFQHVEIHFLAATYQL
jgi:hypothetical protein